MGAAAQGDEQGKVHGFWSPPDGGRIEIKACGQSLCAFIRAKAGNQDTERLDGYLLFENFVYAGDYRWQDGTIYNPENGKSYRSKLRLLPDDRLRVRGCLWLFCDGQTWIRIE